MKAHAKHRFLCLLLTVLMLVSLFPTAALAADTVTSTWEKVELDKITADDVVAITMTKDGATYALPTAGKGGQGQPLAVTAAVDGDKLSIEGGKTDFGWTITASDGTYSIVNASGEHLYVTATNNGVRIGTPQSGKEVTAVFSLPNGYFAASDGTDVRNIGVYNNADWRCYKPTADGSAHANIAGETLGFWKFVSEIEPEPTTEPAEKTMLTKLDGAPADGDTVAIYHPTSSTVLTGTASDAKLAGAAATLVEEQIEQTDAMAMLQVSVTEGVYVFSLDGKVLTSAPTGNGLSFAEDAESDLAKWTLEQQADGTWYLTNVGANYNGNYNQALEYYNGFTTYGVKENNNAYKFAFYADIKSDPVSGLKTGDTVAIFNDGNGKAVTAAASGTRLAAADAKLDEAGALTGENIALFTVTVNDDGTVTFANDGKVLTSGATGSSLTLEATANEYSLWVIEDAGDGLFFVKNANAKYNNNAQYLEYYNTFTTYGKSASAAAKAYAMSFRAVAETPVAAVETPVATPDAGAVEAGTEVTFICATEGAVISYSTDNGETWTEGTSLTVSEAVTVLVKAMKDGAESETASFAYTIKEPEPSYNTVKEALDGENNASFTVKGVVTMVDGRNVYVQDATGGICLYLSAADSSIGLGDTVVGSGAKTVYRGLPELSSAKIEKSEGLTLSAKDTTIGALTTADVCTYVQLKGLEVTEVYDNNGSYSNPNITVKDENDATIQIYKAVVGKTDGAWDVKVGDKVDVKAAVGINNTTLQLRNTVAAEITPAIEAKTGIVTDLADLTDGAKVVILNPANNMALSQTYSGNYNSGVPVQLKDGKLSGYGASEVWTVGVNADGTYTFATADGKKISMAASYTSMPLDEANPNWKLLPVADKTDCFYIENTGRANARMEWYADRGYWSAYYNSNTGDLFIQQFYLVGDEIPGGDEGDVLKDGDQVVIYNASAEGVLGVDDTGLGASLANIPAAISDGKAEPENGAYVFTVGKDGENYTFQTGGKYLATNDAESLFLSDTLTDTGESCAYWTLEAKGDGYLIKSKTARYNNSGVVCIEFFSGAFSGWTFKSTDAAIFVFQFYPIAEGVKTLNDVVNDPKVNFTSADSVVKQAAYEGAFTLDDLTPAEQIASVAVTCNGEPVETQNKEKSYTFTIPGDVTAAAAALDIRVTVTYTDGGSYAGALSVTVKDEPMFENLKPAPGSETGADKTPLISADVKNVTDAASVEMTVNGETVQAALKDGVVSYRPDKALKDGRTSVKLTVTRPDGVKGEKSWTFIVGEATEQLFFGQLHSHTTYSDGSGSLETALDYVKNLPESANVQFVAFTDHSNYFDTTGAANPEGALYDMSLASQASQDTWNTYRKTVADFNAAQADIVAIAGFEMTWSGGPGHINTFNSPGIVSRNNTTLNNKTNDAGMKAYYALLDQPEGADTLSQFNHPGKTFGNFTDFSYWDAVTDSRIFMVEVGNGEGQIGAGGYYPSYEQYIMALDKGWHVAPTNNQDNHKGRWGNANDARDVILTNDFSEQGIYDAIRQRRVYATEDKNLSLTYTLNGEVMGTIIEDLDPSEKIHLAVTIYDPDEADSTAKVEVIANSGTVAYTWDDPEALAEGSLEADLDPQYTYYYIRVTQADGNLAVTAPVWTGKAARIGISGITVSPEQLIVNEPAVLTTELYNEEYPDATVTSVTYTVDGAKILGTDTEAHILEGEGTLEIPFTFTPDTAKRMTITVTAVIDYEGTQLKVSKDITVSVRETAGDLPVTDIADVMKVTEAGYEFAIEGIVVSNASGYDKDTAFFDCIYVEDETGGICCFPVSGEFKIGDKVHVEGYTDFYQGEPELQVESIEVIGSGTVEPQEVTAEQINDLSVLGKLVTIKGTVESFEAVNGLIQTIMVKDEAGNTARVFIDGYITTGYDVENCAAGVPVTATGLASYDDTWPDTDHFARIRIRDRKDVVCGGPLEISETEAEIPTRTTLLLSANKPVTWTSSDEKIATVDENGLVTALRYGRVTITATAEDGERASCEIQTRYYDVNDDSKYYWKPVYWAADNVITKGYDNVYFGPQNNCTREAVVTFLWRLAGQPEPKSTKNPFSDVKSGKYYYKAVLWAAENGITKGYKDGTFRPDDTCLREHVVTFLYRYAGSPSIKPVSNPFNDVKVSDYYYRAAVWANQEGIANGYSEGEHAGGFGPKLDCLREHVVTFLYRYAVK